MSEKICLVLPNRTAPTYVAYDGSVWSACDGHCPAVYQFRRSGSFIDTVCTLRPYRNIRYDPGSGGYTALGEGCGGRVYYLGRRYAERGAVCAGDRFGLVSAGVTPGGTAFNAVYGSRVTVNSIGGRYLDTVADAPVGAKFIDYASYEGGEAFCTESCGTVSVTAGDITTVLPPCTSFRGFIPFGGDLYCAIGSQYIYTYIIQLAENGAADLSELGNSGNFGCNVGVGCCNR